MTTVQLIVRADGREIVTTAESDLQARSLDEFASILDDLIAAVQIMQDRRE